MIREFTTSDFLFLIRGLEWTIALSMISFLGGGFLGLLVAFARISESVVSRIVVICYIRLIQGTPLLMQLFIAFFLPTIFGVQISAWVAACVGLSVNASAFLGETWRGCIQSIPKGQWEASAALGLSYIQQMRYVIAPQALKVAVPPTVGFLVQHIKATSLASIIGFTELAQAGHYLTNSTFRPFLVYSLVAALYFSICWPLTLASLRLELRLRRGR